VIGKALREPLLHFLVLGAALFALYGVMNPAGSGRGDDVVITRGKIEQLAAGFARMHQRAPDAAELDALIDDAVREEIYYREAVALGLDRDDTIVRRRLRQKIEFVSEDVAPVADPTDAQLQAFLAAHPQQFRRATRYSFVHVFVDPQRHGAAVDADVAALRAALVAGGDETAAVGDPFLLAHEFADVEAGELARLFGARFETALRTLPPGEWAGPVQSGYGLHLVRIGRRDDSTPADLADVRDAVAREWQDEQRRLANERYYTALLARYDVTVERPPGDGAGAAALAGNAR
jgi:hypothetical protein